MDNAVRADGRSKVDLDAVRPELDGNGCSAAGSAGLDDGKGKFSSGQEAGSQAADCGERGLRQHLKDLLFLEVLNRKPDVQFGVVEQEIHRIADAEGGAAAGGGAGKLPGGRRQGGPSAGKDVDRSEERRVGKE